MKKCKALSPSPLGLFLGCAALGEYAEDERSYTCVVMPTSDHLNNLPTIHGGYLSALFDEAFAMLIFGKYGNNAAVTINLNVQFLTIVRPRQALTCTVHFTEDDDPQQIKMSGQIYFGSTIVAKAQTCWSLRKNR